MRMHYTCFVTEGIRLAYAEECVDLRTYLVGWPF